MRCSRRKLSGVSSIEFTACVSSFWEASFWLCHFTILCAKHSASLWVSTRLTTAPNKRTSTYSVSTESSSAGSPRTTFHGTFSLKLSSWLWMLGRLPLPSIRCTTGLISQLQELLSTKFSLRSAPCTSTKSSVSASRINCCTRRSKWTCQCCFTWTPQSAMTLISQTCMRLCSRITSTRVLTRQ